MLDPRFIAERMLRQVHEAPKDIMFRFLADDEPHESIDEVQAHIIFKQVHRFCHCRDQSEGV